MCFFPGSIMITGQKDLSCISDPVNNQLLLQFSMSEDSISNLLLSKTGLSEAHTALLDGIKDGVISR